jgi:hypothetical protein
MCRLVQRVWHDPVWSKLIASSIGVVLLASAGLLWRYSAELTPTLLALLQAGVTVARWQLWLGAFVVFFVGVFIGNVAVRKSKPAGSPEPVAPAARLSGPHVARVARPFFFGGLCWRIQPSFFDFYELMDRPTATEVGPLIFGPLCPECGQLRHQRVEPSSQYESPFDVMTLRCLAHGCDHEIEFGVFRGGLGYDDAKLDVYRAAQALALSGKPFPSGPCDKFAESV